MKVQLSRKMLQDHVRGLAKAFDVELRELSHITVREARNVSWHNRNTHQRVENYVEVPTVCDEITYACALHELGHAIDACGQLRSTVNDFNVLTEQTINLRLDEENAAWDWAKANAMVWTRRMQQASEDAYATHVESAKHEKELVRKYGGRFDKTDPIAVLAEILLGDVHLPTAPRANTKPSTPTKPRKTGTLDDFLKGIK